MVHTKSHRFRGPRKKQNFKGAWVGPIWWSWRVSQRGRKKLWLNLGTKTLVAAILESPFYHADSGPGKHHFGILPLDYPQDPSPLLLNSLWAPVSEHSSQATNWVGIQFHLPADICFKTPWATPRHGPGHQRCQDPAPHTSWAETSPSIPVSTHQWACSSLRTSPPHHWMNMSSRTSGGFPGNSAGKESACNAGDPDLIPESVRSPGEGHGNSLQYFYLGNPMDRGAWWAIVHGVAKSWTWLSTSTHICGTTAYGPSQPTNRLDPDLG